MAQTRRVVIVDPSGSKKTTVEVPDNVEASRLTGALVKRMGLPEIGQNGRPVSYRLTCTREGEENEINPDQTFEDAGIENDDVLRLYADMQAGKGEI